MEVFICVVALITLLLVLPIGLYVNYDGNTTVTLRYLFLRIKLFPRAKKKPKAAKKAATKQGDTKKKKGTEGKQSGRELLDYIEWVPTLLRSLGRGGGYILKRTVIAGIVVRIRIARDDAAKTAIAYGQANAALYTALSLLSTAARLRPPKEISITPDFLGQEDSAYAQVAFRVRPSTVVFGGILFLIGILTRMMQQALAPEV